MERRIAVVTMLAGLTLGASGTLPAAVTTNSYDPNSTSGNIQISCKELFQRSGGELRGYCNKAGNGGTVSAVFTTINMPAYANCLPDGDDYTLQWGAQEEGIKPLDPAIVLTSTGTSYLLEARCKRRSDGEVWEATTLPIGDSTDGLENDDGSFAKR